MDKSKRLTYILYAILIFSLYILLKPSEKTEQKVEEIKKEISGETSFQFLKDRINDSDPGERAKAVSALGRKRNPKYASDLIKILKEDDNQKVRLEAIKALERIKSKEAVPALISATCDFDSRIKRKAIWALGEIGDSRAASSLTNSLNDVETEICREAVFAIEKLGVYGEELKDTWVVQSLVSVIRNPYSDIQKEAAWALREIGDKAAVPGLLQTLEDKNPSVRKYAVSALAELGDKDIISALEKLLNDEDEQVRKSAGKAIESIKQR